MRIGIAFTPFETRTDVILRLATQADDLGVDRVDVAEGWTHDSMILLAELALRFVLSSEALTTVTLSMGDAKEVDSAIAAADKGTLQAAVFERIYRHHGWVKNFWT